MAEGSFQEKTEKATPKKREKAREEGQVARSVEVPAVFVLLAAVAVFHVFGHFFYNHLLGVLRSSLAFDSVPDFTLQYCAAVAPQYINRFLLIMMPVFGAVLVVALAANLLQVGFHASSKAIAPKLNKLDVIKGVGRLFSLKSLMELVKSVLKLTIIGMVAYFAVKGEVGHLLKLYDADAIQIFVYLLKSMFKIFIWVILVMIVVAILDYTFQKWKFEKDIMMTKQEIKDELKQAEGDPHVKSRIRSIQQQAARKRMMQELPEADVVVTNPTHLALAIKYDPGSMNAPKVVAKGAGKVAERIKRIAKDHDIPVVENKKLARNLYKLVEVGAEVPSELYRAVAELLAYVYKLKGKKV